MACCGSKKDFDLPSLKLRRTGELRKLDMLLTWAIEHGDKEEEERLRKLLDKLQEKVG